MFDVSMESILVKFVKSLGCGGEVMDHPSYSLIRLAWRFTYLFASMDGSEGKRRG